MCFVFLSIFFTACLCPFHSYRPNLSVSYISGVLGFSSEEDCLAFLVGMEAVMTADGASVDCKLMQAKLTSVGAAA